MSPVHLRNFAISRKKPEDKEGLSRNRRPGRGHLGKSGGWHDTEGNQTLKDCFQWRIDNKRFNLASHWAEHGESRQQICLREMSFKDLIENTKGWNPTRQLRLLEERETRIRENQATIQAIEEQLNHTGPTLIPSGSQRVDQPSSLVASHHSGTRR
ncbi:hypothetical protein O181_005042 [Austropuccinia psidii MF-1]|uniref:Uncharacterized protein n=1 Tax=Austropuccinia psidii MF-1 TaxID=1389203 RepID=A0A9Q3GGC5_9BASI|nr:hypothetical protein [Austropuccinia psidii MF-1]